MRALLTSCLLLFLLAVGGFSSAIAANLGPDDRQVSFTGPAGTTATDAFSPAIAFDSTNQRYLLVWSADEVDGDFRIYAQLLTGTTGAPIGSPFVLTDPGAAGSDQRQPAVAFDATRDRYLVVWSGDEANPGAAEIRSQVIDANGQYQGNTQRLSDMGTNDTDTRFDAVTPDVVWHPDLDAFIVVWVGDDDTGSLGDGRFECYGQLVDGATGTETGVNDFRISFAGPDGDGNDVLEPTLAVRPGSSRWFMAFEGDIVDDGVHDPEVWMYGCTADVPDASGVLISMMGTGFDDGLNARHPDLAWVPSSGELICVWDGDLDGVTPRAIYGQRLLPDGTLVGSVIPISGGTAPPGGPLREAIEPTVAIDPTTDEWFIAWRGDIDDSIPWYDHEIWACRFNDIGNPIPSSAFTLSAMDQVLEPVAGAGAPALAINGTLGYKLIAWAGDLDTTVGGENEIFVQAWADDAFSAVETPGAGSAFALHGAAPNPFNPLTTIAFDLPRAQPVTLRVYDAAGRLVRTLLAAEPGLAGRNEVIWNGQDDRGKQAASGVYLYRLETADQRRVGRMTLIK